MAEIGGVMNSEFARRQMVEQQIRTWDVFEEELLDLFRSVPREDFVPSAWRRLAYAEAEIPLGHGERMMRPSVEGRMLQGLDIGSEDHVLEIGTGSGFITACLARLAHSVTSIDLYEDFLSAAADKLARHRLDNVSLERRDAVTDGPPDGAFDAIAVTGSLPAPDERLFAALKPGGRLFVVIGEAPVMEARLYTRADTAEPSATVLFETCLPRLQNVAEPSHFTF